MASIEIAQQTHESLPAADTFRVENPAFRELEDHIKEKNTHRKIKGIIFDFDGVLVSFESRFIWPLLQTIKKMEPDLTREEIEDLIIKMFNKLATFPNPEGIRFLKFFMGIEITQKVSFLQKLRFLVTFLLSYIKNKELIPIIGVRETLRELLAENYKMILITNSSRRTIIEATEIIPELKEFDLTITRDEVEVSKPNPEGFLRALNTLDLKPENVVSIGDQASDILVGEQVGTITVAITEEYMAQQLRAHLQEYHPEFLLSDIREFPELITQLNSKVASKEELFLELSTTNPKQKTV